MVFNISIYIIFFVLLIDLLYIVSRINIRKRTEVSA